MFLTNGFGVTIDIDLDLLRHILNALDEQLDAWCAEAVVLSDPDAFGVFDRIEHISGLGFVACQTYLAATYAQVKVPKDRALTFGPKHSSGMPIVTLVKHASNFWKHHDEWALQKNTKARDRIIDAFDMLGYPALGEYPLSGCLVELCGTNEARFKHVVAHLGAWRDALRAG